MRKVLFLVHVEEMFRQFFPTMYVPRICKAMCDYDDVYMFISGVDDDDPIREVRSSYYTHIDWGWGWCQEQFEGQPEEREWLIDNTIYHYDNHEMTWIPPELRSPEDWEDCQISLGGGARNECLNNMVNALNHQQIPFKPVQGLIYG